MSRQVAIWLLCRPTAIDEDIRTGNEAGFFGTKVTSQLADLFDLAPAAERNPRKELSVEFGVTYQGSVHLGGNRARTNAIDSDLFRGQFKGKGASEPKQG